LGKRACYKLRLLDIFGLNFEKSESGLFSGIIMSMLSNIKKFIIEYFDSFKTRFFPKLSNIPHMEMTTIEVLRKKLSTAVVYIEYGVGGSTLLAMSIQVPSIISVETDRRWIQRIKNSSRKVGSTSQLELLHADIGKVTS